VKVAGRSQGQGLARTVGEAVERFIADQLECVNEPNVEGHRVWPLGIETYS
jgi:hypothetical protein